MAANRKTLEFSALSEFLVRTGRARKHHVELISLLDEKPPSSITAAELAAKEAGNIFHTGIKALDLFAPIQVGGVIRVDGPTNAGRLIALSGLAAVASRRSGLAWPKLRVRAFLFQPWVRSRHDSAPSPLW